MHSKLKHCTRRRRKTSGSALTWKSVMLRMWCRLSGRFCHCGPGHIRSTKGLCRKERHGGGPQAAGYGTSQLGARKRQMEMHNVQSGHGYNCYAQATAEAEMQRAKEPPSQQFRMGHDPRSHRGKRHQGRFHDLQEVRKIRNEKGRGAEGHL